MAEEKIKLPVYAKDYFFVGTDMERVREALNMTQFEFSLRCDWTQSYQSNLELPGTKHVLTEKIEEGLGELGIEIEKDG
jgi:hypothetical protein